MATSLPRPVLVAGAIIAAGAAFLAWSFAVPRSPQDVLDRQAEEYVLLALALDALYDGEVDAWFGPPALREDAAGRDYTLADITARTASLREDILAAEDTVLASRRAALLQKTEQLLTVTDVIGRPSRLPFAQELDLLYGITLPGTDTDTEALQESLATLLPGQGSLAFRMASFQNKLVIPPDRRQAVFEAALAECRRRTVEHWPMPAEENLAIEWTRDVQAAWHEYLGNYQSSLRINALTVALVGSAVDLACHEAYPGHHAQFVMMEQAGDWHLEDMLVLLRSPTAVLGEGAASVAASLAFTPEERLAFERDVLFPLAGLPGEAAETSFRIHQLVNALSPAIIPVIRDYYDGVVEFNAATFSLERDAMVTSPSQLLEFVNTYGTYSSGYTIVRDIIEARLAAAGSTGARWEALRALLVKPAPAALDSLQSG